MASTYLSRTLGTPTNAYKGTLSYWQKAASTTATNYILACESGNERMLFYMAAGKFQAGLRGTSSPPDIDFTISGTPRFRDPNAWYHVVLAWDSTQSTASDRMKLYVNNVQYTWTGSGTGGVNDIPQNHVMPMNKSGLPFRIGSTIGGGSYFEGVMSHIHFVDGTAYTPSTFGETDSTTGEWKIKTDPSVTYGNNGFWWLKDTNAATDSSPNSNTPSIGGTLTKTEDCPSNVFATLNPLVNNQGEMMLLTNGNTSCQSNAAQGNSWKLAVSTLGMTSGKYYWEIKFDNVHNCYNNGVMGSNILTANTSNPMNQTGYTGFYNYDGGEIRKDNVVTTQDYGTYATNDIMGVACDMDNYTITFYKNGSAFVSNVALSTTGRDVVFPCSVFYNTNNTGIPQASYNFGNGYFGTTAISSAGSNGNGSLFEYDVPSGYYALNTKNINTYG